eukprot:4964626-Karenia_brevis.AAC.1
MKLRRAHNDDDRRRERKEYGKMCRRWWAQKAAMALDRVALHGARDSGKCRKIPSFIHIGGECLAIRSQWPAAMARYYEKK